MPFTIQPAEGPTFVNREEELKDILATLKVTSNFCNKRRILFVSFF